MQEEVNSLKAEVETLKNTLKLLISIREESEHMQSYIRDIKVDIHILNTNNRELNERLNNLEKDVVREKDSNCDPEFLKHVSESSIKNNSEQFKCDKCNYTEKTSVSLKKHKNTKHLHEDADCSNKEESESVSDCINDLFQMEFIEDEQVYACNVCNKGFDKNKEIKKHIEKEHKDIIVQIRKDMKEEDESDSDISSNDESYGDAWLANYDNDGNFMG